MYGKLLVLLMLAFCLTEVMDNQIKPLAFQVGGGGAYFGREFPNPIVMTRTNRTIKG